MNRPYGRECDGYCSAAVTKRNWAIAWFLAWLLTATVFSDMLMKDKARQKAHTKEGGIHDISQG